MIPNLLVLAAALAWSQDQTPAFEVTSIKLVQVEANAPHPISCSGGRFLAENVPAEYVIAWAYLIKNEFTVPPWASREGDKFVIEAKAAGPISLDTCRLMVQQMLEDRFQLKLHNETKEASVYYLTVAKGGAKLREVKPDTVPADSDGIFLNRRKLTGRGWETWKLASYLGGLPPIGRPVVDKTGMPGLYQFSLDFSGEGRPDIFTTIQEQLGLKLEAGKAPVETFVIDRLEKPSAN
jgi:uncharacterized protein (TIGR03435 family)